MVAYTVKHLTHSAKVLITFFLGFLGRDRFSHLYTQGWLLPAVHLSGMQQLIKIHKLAAAVINLAGMVGMVPLNGAKRGLDGPG